MEETLPDSKEGSTRRGGRPKKDPSQKREYRKFYLSDAEYEDLQRRQKVLGFTDFSVFVRFLCFENIERVKVIPQANKDLIAQIQKIGVNLNQVARAANSLKGVEKKEELQAMTGKIAKELREIMLDLNPKLSTKK